MNIATVLLVDDEVPFVEAMTRRLTKRNLTVLTAFNGQESLTSLGTNSSVDVVILDVKMPGMDGIETLKQIKKLRPLVEVIMLTGHANMEVAIEGMELGAFDYLMNPMEIDEPLYKLQDAFKKKQLHESKIDSVEEELGPKR